MSLKRRLNEFGLEVRLFHKKVPWFLFRFTNQF